MTKELSTIKKIKEIKKEKYIDPVGKNVYGEHFDGFQKIEHYIHLLPSFKEFYYQKKNEDLNKRHGEIIKEFNDGLIEGEHFWPYLNQYRSWRKKWDAEILDQQGIIIPVDTPRRMVNKLVKTKSDGEKYIVPQFEELEAATQTLGGELLNDALYQLESDQRNNEEYSSDELMKRKKHVLDVFSHVSKMVQGKANLTIKAAAEKREEVGFIMDFMRAAASGALKPEEIEDLQKIYKPNIITKEADVK